MVHQASSNPSGSQWSSGCVTVHGPGKGIAEMWRFANLIGTSEGCKATLIVSR